VEQANYIVEQVDATTLESLEILNASDASLIDDFQIDSEFNQNTDIIRLDYLSLAGNILSSNFDYRDYSQLLGSSAAGRDGAVNLTLFPDQDAVRGGYDNGDVILVYNFFQNLLSMNGRRGGELFVRDISPDRFEFRALTTQIEDVDLTSKVTDIAARLADNSYFSEFYLDFKDKGVKIAINIAPDTVEQGAAVVFRMYEPLPANIAANDLFTVETKVSDTVAFRVTREFVEDRTVVIPAAGPNFNPQQIENEKNPTEFQSLSELYSSGLGMGGPGSIINSGSYELEALLREKGANISIDYTDYSNFVHFSNAEERLRNFRYKLDLIKSYESSLASLETGSMSGPGITGSRDFYSNQIRTVLRGFDGYDRHLYFESGSTSWPKQSGSTEPYINLPSSHTSASKWYNDQIEVAEGYDNTNPDNILNAVPAFLREDARNEPYLLYANMIGQHFDSIWVYTKAVADKYDTDHRKNHGIASSMLRSAIESLGVKYYDSTFNLSSIFNSYIGSTYNTGSEMINNLVMVTSGSYSPDWSGSAAQYLPVSQNDYIEEVQKRIYHNLPLLNKAKGTYKAMNVLLNSFGIPPSFLPVRSFGGTNTNASQDFGPAEFQTSSLGKIRIDNTGSMATGSTLSRYTSTEIPDGKYSDDSQALEIGIDLSSTMNSFIRQKINFNFDIDQYIGDPRAQFSDNYFVLNNEALSLTVEGRDYDPHAQNEVLNTDYVTGSVGLNPTTVTRLLQFYDTSVFRMMQDFTPARASANPGLTIRNHILHRPKARAVSASSFQQIYTSSFSIGSASGVQGGGAFPEYKTEPYTTNYEFTGSTPIGAAPVVVSDQRPRYNGEFGRFNRERNTFEDSVIVVSTTSFQENNPFLTTLQPDLSYDLSAVTLTSLAASTCNLAFFFTNLGDLFEFHIVDHSAATRATAQITYPTASSFTNMETVEIDWDEYEFVSVTAGAASYPFGSFEGWYTTASGSGTLVTSSATLTVFDGYEDRYGTNKFYARYESTHSNPFD
jgi:hypothetical protein